MAEAGSYTMPDVNNVTLENIENTNLMSLWNSDTYTRMRRMMHDSGWNATCRAINSNEDCPLRCGGSKKDLHYLSYEGFCTDLQDANDDAAQKSFNVGEEIVSHYPISIELRLGTMCNLDCEMCTQTPWKGTHTSLPRSLIEGDDFGKFLTRARRLILTGGEPTISPLMPPIINAAQKARGAKIFLITNGHRLCDTVLPNPEVFSWINVSLDAGDRGTYQKTRKGGSWNRVTNQIRTFNAENTNDINIFISCVVSGMNYQKLDLVIENAHDLGVNHVVFNEVHSIDGIMNTDQLRRWKKHLSNPSSLDAAIKSAQETADALDVRMDCSIPSIGAFH